MPARTEQNCENVDYGHNVARYKNQMHLKEFAWEKARRTCSKSAHNRTTSTTVSVLIRQIGNRPPRPQIESTATVKVKRNGHTGRSNRTTGDGRRKWNAIHIQNTLYFTRYARTWTPRPEQRKERTSMRYTQQRICIGRQMILTAAAAR